MIRDQRRGVNHSALTVAAHATVMLLSIAIIQSELTPSLACILFSISLRFTNTDSEETSNELPGMHGFFFLRSIAGLKQQFDLYPKTAFVGIPCLFLRCFAVDVGSGCVLKAQKKDGCVCLPVEEPMAIADSSFSILNLLSPFSGSSLCCSLFPLSQTEPVVAIWQDLLVCLFF